MRMDHSKIRLSAEEMQLVGNSEWILTKHRIIEKVYVLFGELATQMQQYLEDKKPQLPPALLQVPPKISKGEQYEALPYVVLDYPRVFSKENVFAVRSFFWWGHYFSITLHLKGAFQQQYFPALAAAIAQKKLEGFYFCGTGNEFSFNLNSKHYTMIHKAGMANDSSTSQAFKKLSYRVSFDQWEGAGEKLMAAFQQLTDIITA
jgi:hypothetical protein